MTDVVSYRTEKIDKLKKIAEQKNISLSQLSSDIIDDYLEFSLLVENYPMMRISKKLFSYSFSFFDDSELEKLIDFASKEANQTVKTIVSDYSLPNILLIVRTWFKYNDLKLQEFDETSSFKFVCKNENSLNWNKFITGCLLRLFKSFGYSGSLNSVEEGFFSISIVKNKSN